MMEGSLEVNGKVEVEESGKRKIQKRNSQQTKDTGARKGRKVAIHRVFPFFWPAQAAGTAPSGDER